jgi:hypothetical protein
MKYICVDDTQCAGLGNSLSEAFEDYQANHGDGIPAENLNFYEVHSINIEVKIVPVEKISKVK